MAEVLLKAGIKELAALELGEGVMAAKVLCIGGRLVNEGILVLQVIGVLHHLEV